jgi:hypothetical protein
MRAWEILILDLLLHEV